MDPVCNRLLVNEVVQQMETAVQPVYTHVFKDFDAIFLKTSPQLMQTFSDDLQAVRSVGGKDQLGSLSSWLVEVETSLEDCHQHRLE